ncbi:glycosyltransferase family 4 protein [Sediminicola luteus]|uniref:Glycosyl transferase family 1 n=1 Tax=Sediminicola luteus TaxID=319238 RepID=A0A2A4GEW7_9FLAO|nr:glycosyltransferase family 4 protein [Sediminicola luteus]PCE66548.1 glycosyl transferase family 1 [Sediminicola luteus]
MKTVLVHDWYYTNGGAEKVIRSIDNIWNDIEHFSLIDNLNDHDRQSILNGKTVTTTYLQKWPLIKKRHRLFLQLFPSAIESLDLRNFDLILSSSSAVAKGVLTNQNQLHICYCHSPARYAWDLYHQTLEDSNLKRGLKGFYAKYVLHKMRVWDVVSSNRVDVFVANSKYIAKRIKKVYRRDAHVIYPPVDVNRFELIKNKEDYFLTASRLVPYKKIELIVQSFNQMPNKKLIVIGNGPEFKKISKIANNNVLMLGFQSNETLKEYMQKAKAFVFAAEEDFGIMPVEAQACGTPVIGYGKGGLTETVINNETGLFFDEQNTEAIVNAVSRFEKLQFDSEKIRTNALRFSKERFELEFRNFVFEKFQEFNRQKNLL